jgi:hypothetical protein
VTQFKSPWRRTLQRRSLPTWSARGASSATRSNRRVIAGAPRPWDVEFGFVGGKPWLFQCRQFVGNDARKNVIALVALEGPVEKGTETVSLEENLK